MIPGDDSRVLASDDSSSSVASFRSSSSLSTRADIDYKDTLKLGDTTRVYIELFDGDSSKMDESEIYIDSATNSIPLYLGEFFTPTHRTSTKIASASRTSSATTCLH